MLNKVTPRENNLSLISNSTKGSKGSLAGGKVTPFLQKSSDKPRN